MTFRQDYLSWSEAKPDKISQQSYTCGFCGAQPGPSEGWYSNGREASIFICSTCGRPTFFDRSGKQTPGVRFGAVVSHLPSDVEGLYDEARGCMAINAYTAATMLCRKLLMHVAVDQQAEAKKTFQFYVEYLVEKGLVSAGARGWVDAIRKAGNEPNHEIQTVSKSEAERTMAFVEGLLRNVYEYPARLSVGDELDKQREAASTS